ncbi:MAG: DNA adenine methylase [Phycisphaeraceae bacterium]|nr:DNA adenine methylase [Phycisphaeraceae bacterium]MCW5754429.1 DNA adenine methylase [Phycisphaeraceae bacterium]
MIKYLGSKRTLLPAILAAVGDVPEAASVLDIFSGTSRVGHALKARGYRVYANDHNAYAACLARCYVQADAEDVAHEAKQLIDEFNTLPGAPGYFTEHYSLQARFIHPANGERIDAIREAIAARALDPELESVVLTSLLEAADRVDSTTGVQMAYLKSWAKRARNPLHLRLPALLPRAPGGKGAATCLEALDAAARFDADIAYLDPPYNQHSYLGNYHVWESLVRWDKPPVYGVACKRIDCRERRSPFNSRRSCEEALLKLLRAVRARTLIISFNNEGYMQRDRMERLLESFDPDAERTVIEHDYPRYVGARIGIYNPRGEKVGAISHVRNREYLYVIKRSMRSGVYAAPAASTA